MPGIVPQLIGQCTHFAKTNFILLASLMADHVLYQYCPVPFPRTTLLGLLSHCPSWGVTLKRMEIIKLIIMMFQWVLNTTGIFQKISYTVWNTSLILSHPPSLLGHCPKFDRMISLTASLLLSFNAINSFIENPFYSSTLLYIYIELISYTTLAASSNYVSVWSQP